MIEFVFDIVAYAALGHVVGGVTSKHLLMPWLDSAHWTARLALWKVF